jgi:hypothetical protein
MIHFTTLSITHVLRMTSTSTSITEISTSLIKCSWGWTFSFPMTCSTAVETLIIRRCRIKTSKCRFVFIVLRISWLSLGVGLLKASICFCCFSKIVCCCAKSFEFLTSLSLLGFNHVFGHFMRTKFGSKIFFFRLINPFQHFSSKSKKRHIDLCTRLNHLTSLFNKSVF